ncbi:MAG TPA: hypothetical protein VJM12_17700 [Pyrinomonadaceae bacterium]|nr:hypothetical protein [Pyrinomonadaceae bacterium]
MKGKESSKTLPGLRTFSASTPLIALVIIAIAIGAAIVLPLSTHAADPASATLGPTLGNSVSWRGTAPGGVSDGEGTCVEGVNCETFTLNVSGTQAEWAGKRIRLKINWQNDVNDYDVYVHKDTLNGPLVTRSADGFTNSETCFLDPEASGTGNYAVHVVYFAATAADQYSGLATTEVKPTGGTSSEAPPRYFNYAAPGGLGRSAGEPSLGVNWTTGNVMYISGLETLRVSFDDASSPAQSTWTNSSALNTSLRTLDPILFTDSDVGAVRTNRTFVSQLAGRTSLMSFTDNDGDTWTPSQGGGISSGVDHQTVGGGPYARNPDGSLKGGAVQRPGPDGRIYPHAVYYASQDVGLAEAARSDDGGFSFGPAVPMWTLAECGGLHGAIKVARDGTVYVPNKSCTGKQAVVVSEDNGVTWTTRTIPGSTSGRTDPSVGIGEDGTIYVGYANGDGHARIAVSGDRGRSWENDIDVGAAVGIQNTVFPGVVAGDSDRAAYFFLGTTTGGNGTGSDPNFSGTWYGFIATTYDRGATWVVVNATPGDPAQRGSVCTNGINCPSGPPDTRNLLDFNDVTIDQKGRVVAAYADGCITPGCIQGVDKNNDGNINSLDNDGSELATIIRQSGGKSLLAAFDDNRIVPDAPQLIVNLSGSSANLAWSTPDNGGSAITGYHIYRNNARVASVGAETNSFTDSPSGPDVAYRVSAVNANGEGVLSKAVFPTIPETACVVPGITVAKDTSDLAPNAPVVPQVNIGSLHIAEPFLGAGVNKLVFTLKVGAGAVPANTQWYVIWQRPVPDANHDRNYIALKSSLTGGLTFEHGRVSYPLVFTSPAPNQGNIPTKFGDAAGSYDPATGTITIIVDNNQVDSPTAGQSLIGLEVRTFLGRSDSLPINQNIASDFAVGATYTLVGNASCLQPPAAPTNLVASSPSKGKPTGEITLTWKDNSDNEESFHIERSTLVDSGFEQIATVGANVTTYVDQAQRKVTYFYRIRAGNSSGKSAYSNVASARAR